MTRAVNVQKYGSFESIPLLQTARTSNTPKELKSKGCFSPIFKMIANFFKRLSGRAAPLKGYALLENKPGFEPKLIISSAVLTRIFTRNPDLFAGKNQKIVTDSLRETLGKDEKFISRMERLSKTNQNHKLMETRLEDEGDFLVMLINEQY